MIDKPHNKILPAHPVQHPLVQVLLHIFLPVIAIVFLVMAGQGLTQLMGDLIVGVKRWWPFWGVWPVFISYFLLVLMCLLFAPLNLIQEGLVHKGKVLKFTLLVPIMEIMLVFTLAHALPHPVASLRDELFQIYFLQCLVTLVGVTICGAVEWYCFVIGMEYAHSLSDDPAAAGMIWLHKYLVYLVGIWAVVFLRAADDPRRAPFDYIKYSILPFLVTKIVFAGPLGFTSSWLYYYNQLDKPGKKRLMPALAKRALLVTALSVGVVALVGYLRTPTLPRFEFVRISAGKFMMGDNDFKKASEAVEKLRFGRVFSLSDKDRNLRLEHEVTLSQPFEMGKYEVTQAQSRAVMGSWLDGECYAEDYTMKDKTHEPVCVSWDEIQEFIIRLNAEQNKYKYRLPTEAEWEYAARAGTANDYGEPGDRCEECTHKVHPVGEKQPNRWGLYDMQGNVWEWCQDWYGDYASEAVTDPLGPSTGSGRVMRCCAYYVSSVGPNDAFDIRASGMHQMAGFRLVRIPL